MAGDPEERRLKSLKDPLVLKTGRHYDLISEARGSLPPHPPWPQGKDVPPARGCGRGFLCEAAQAAPAGSFTLYDKEGPTKLNREIPVERLARSNLAATHRELDAKLEELYVIPPVFEPQLDDPQGPYAAQLKFAIVEIGAPDGHGDYAILVNGKRELITMAPFEDTHKIQRHGEGKPQVLAESKFASIEAAKAAVATLGAKVVEGKPELLAWKKEELETAHAGLSSLSPQERQAVGSFELVRLAAHSDASVNATFDGQPTDPAKNGAWQKGGVLKIYNRAFERDDTSFYGSGVAGSRVPESVGTMVHELGHAIALRERRDELVTAFSAYQVSKEPFSQAFSAWEQAAKQRPPNEGQECMPLYNAVVASSKAFMAVWNGPLGDAGRRQALAQAVTQRDQALSALESGFSSNALIPQAKSVVEKQRDLLRCGLAAQDFAEDQPPPRSIQDFLAFCDQHAIEPPTSYGSSAPHEYFADAFMLFKLDPDFLKKERPALFDYFQSGRHLR